MEPPLLGRESPINALIRKSNSGSPVFSFIALPVLSARSTYLSPEDVLSRNNSEKLLALIDNLALILFFTENGLLPS